MKEVILIGAGDMAIAYSKVLKDLSVKLTVVGRGVTSSLRFEEKTGIKCIAGGIQEYSSKCDIYGNIDRYIIIAVGTEELISTLNTCLKLKPRRVLIEKPGAISIEEILNINDNIKNNSNKIFVAYNRRFYQSVQEVQNLISDDGGLTSFNFEFTEWAHTITPLKKAKGVKENWLFANSTHVIDLAFFLGGFPQQLSSYISKSKEIDWHNNSIFTGAGLTQNGIPFSYSANWESAGRWAIELYTLKNKYYLKPLEKIYIQKRGSIEINEFKFDQTLDENYKPGLYKQTEAFLLEQDSNLLNLDEQTIYAKEVYSKILKGEN